MVNHRCCNNTTEKLLFTEDEIKRQFEDRAERDSYNRRHPKEMHICLIQKTACPYPTCLSIMHMNFILICTLCLHYMRAQQLLVISQNWLIFHPSSHWSQKDKCMLTDAEQNTSVGRSKFLDFYWLSSRGES